MSGGGRVRWWACQTPGVVGVEMLDDSDDGRIIKNMYYNMRVRQRGCVTGRWRVCHAESVLG